MKSTTKCKERDYTNNKLVVTLDETFIERGYPKKGLTMINGNHFPMR